MRIKSAILAALFVLVAISCSSAKVVQRPVFRWSQYFRFNNRQSDHRLYVNRLSAAFSLTHKEKKELFRIIPFFESRNNIDRDIWERNELGVEVGKDVFPFLYVGQAFQAVWLKEDYQEFTYHDRRHSSEAETRLVLSHQLFKKGGLQIKGFILDEYIFDFDIGSSTRNEIALGVIVPLTKYLETQLNWRHLDRIHDFDSDVIEAQATLVF